MMHKIGQVAMRPGVEALAMAHCTSEKPPVANLPMLRLVVADRPADGEALAGTGALVFEGEILELPVLH
jgi:hypothetical protein